MRSTASEQPMEQPPSMPMKDAILPSLRPPRTGVSHRRALYTLYTPCVLPRCEPSTRRPVYSVYSLCAPSV